MRSSTRGTTRASGPIPSQGIYQIDTTNFGPAPDELDNDPKIYVLLYDFDIAADGFFWVFDEYPDGSQPYASNECEVLYINSSDNDPGGSYLISVMAHEFEHMIHWLADADEDAWVDEGMAELAMWLYGDPDPVIQFPTNPDIDLTGLDGSFSDYVKTYLWSLYFYEQFGGPAGFLGGRPRAGQRGSRIRERPRHALGSPLELRRCLRKLDVRQLPRCSRASIRGSTDMWGRRCPPSAAVLKSTYPVPLTTASVQRYAADYVKFIERFSHAPPVRRRGCRHLEAPRPVPECGDRAEGRRHTARCRWMRARSISSTSARRTTRPSSSSRRPPLRRDDLPVLDGGGPRRRLGSVHTLALHLGAGSPNPMRTAGTITIDLPRGQGVDLSVFDSSGRIVRTLAHGERRRRAARHPLGRARRFGSIRSVRRLLRSNAGGRRYCNVALGAYRVIPDGGSLPTASPSSRSRTGMGWVSTFCRSSPACS